MANHYVNLAEAMVKDAHVKVESLIDQGTSRRILRVESIVLSILIDQISANGPALVQVEAIVIDGRDVVLRVDLEEFRFHLLTGHQIQLFQVEFNAHQLGSHHDGTARGTGLHVIQVDSRHVGRCSKHVDTRQDLKDMKNHKSHRNADNFCWLIGPQRSSVI